MRSTPVVNLRGAVLAIALAVAVAALPAGRAEAQYQVIDLGTLGGTYSSASAINNNGTIVGWADTDVKDASNSQIREGFVYQNGVMSGIKNLGTGSEGFATGINSNGGVAGYSATINIISDHAYQYDSTSGGGSPTDINPALGALVSSAHGINDSGVIVGSASQFDANSNLVDFAYRYDGTTFSQILGAANNDSPYTADGINAAGQVVGAMQVGYDPISMSYSNAHAYRTDANGNAVDIDAAYAGFSRATAINSATPFTAGGDAVGYRLNSNRSTIATAWGSDGSINVLGTLGGSSSIATALDSFGTIVGGSTLADGTNHAFIYDPYNGMQDLNALLNPGQNFTLTQATGINDLGEIVGFGLDRNGNTHAFLLELGGGAVPEPSSIVLLSAGAGLLGAAAIRRRRPHRA